MMMIRQSATTGEAIPERIVILRALQLGDLLCAVPAFRALKTALPHAKITLIGLPWSQEFVRRFSHYLDDFIEFPGFPGFPERAPQIERIPLFLGETQRRNFDLAIQMQGSGWLANSLVVLFGAGLNAGFCVPGEYCPDESRFLVYPNGDHEIVRHLKLMDFLGWPSQGHDLEFPLDESDWLEFQQLQQEHSLEAGSYICIHPGGRALDRRWPTDYFVTIADRLAEQGHQIVLTGTEIEKALTLQVADAMKYPAINLAGETSLGSLGALISNARLLICNDTGVSHVAAALRKPSLVLSRGSDPIRWSPLDRALHRTIEWSEAASHEELWRTAEELLRQVPAYTD